MLCSCLISVAFTAIPFDGTRLSLAEHALLTSRSCTALALRRLAQVTQAQLLLV